MSNHTPGPWKVMEGRDPNSYKYDDVMSACNRRVCNVYGGLTYPPGLANARLIASAPELLEIAEGLMEVKELNISNYDHDDVCQVMQQLSELWSAASLILAKVNPAATQADAEGGRE